LDREGPSQPFSERLRGHEIESGTALSIAHGKRREIFIQTDAERRAFTVIFRADRQA
jgi:hypothetical protein